MKSLKPILFGLTAAGLLFFGLSFGIDGLAPARWYCFFLALAALSFIPESRLIRNAFSIAILAALVFFVTQLFSETHLGNKKLDLTEDNRYSLTEGTEAILNELAQPVTINYYVTRDVTGTPANVKRHIPRVDSFLREITALAKDNLITLNFIDPKPNTDEEDAALLDQVQQVDVTRDDRLIFGASISSLDKKTVIPIFDPESEPQLEFQVISAIAEVTTQTPPVVGLISAHTLNVGGQSGQGWLFYQILDRSYDVINLGMSPLENLTASYEQRAWGEAPTFLDPEKIPLLLVIHPAEISPEAEFALDQYLLRGGSVIACLDPFSLVAQESGGQPQFPGMPPQGGIPVTSTLPKLLEKHNVEFSPQVLVDRTYAVPNNPGVMLLDQNAMPIKDDISLASVQNLAFLFTGGFSPKSPNQPIGPGLTTTRLVESSFQHTFVDAQALMSRDGANQLRFALANRQGSDRQLALVTHLQGTFETAFPEGDPASEPDPSDSPDQPEEEKEKEKESLTTGTSPGNLYLIADSDFLYDGLAYQFQRFGNAGFMQPVSGNGPFILNLIDQAVGSKYLIGARARTPSYRTFTVLKDKEAELEKQQGEKIEQFRSKAEEAASEIQKVRAQVTENNSAQLTPELSSRIEEYQRVEVEARKGLREAQKSYQSEIDGLKASIFFKSVFYTPIIIITLGLAVFFYRRTQIKAR